MDHMNKNFGPTPSFKQYREINTFFIYEPRFNGVFSRHILPRIKDRKYVINLDDEKSKVFIGRSTVVLFDSFGIEYTSYEVLSKIKDKCITHNIFIIQSDDSIMYRFHCIVFIEYMLAGETLLDCTNLFSPYDYKKLTK